MKTMFLKSFLFIGLSILLCFSINSLKAQSLKGKIWQSQDTTNLNDRPSTIIFEDSTYTMHEFRYTNHDVITYTDILTQVGWFEVKLGNLTLVRCIDGRPVRSYSYKLIWKSDTEFSIIAGIQKTSYSLFNTPEDHFTPKLIVPYLKKAIEEGEVTPACFANISNRLKSERDEKKMLAKKDIKETKTTLSENVGLVNTFKNNYSIKGKRWQIQNVDEVSGCLSILTFTDDGDYFQNIACLDKDPQTGKLVFGEAEDSDVVTVLGKYKERNDSISITEEKLFSKKLKTTLFKIVWINEFEFELTGKFALFVTTNKYALFCSPKDLTTRRFRGMYTDIQY